MTESMTYLVRGLSLAALLLAGSCALPPDQAGGTSLDGAANNPIQVQPAYQALKLYYSPADRGLTAADAPRFAAFVENYLARGNGSIIVSAPSGAAANEQIAFFAGRINEMGVSRDHIIVSTHDAPSNDMRVELNYVTYTASPTPCGIWDEDLSQTYDNSTPRNFGCAVQQNIAAVVSDPRDLLGPRPMDDSDGRRRDAVMGNYEQGKITSADKRKGDLGNEQSGTSSQVGK
jgi:pilus assembly protein CpaD